jgi:hypothetical protein
MSSGELAGPRQRTSRHDLPEHEARGPGKAITTAIDTHVEDEKRKNGDEGRPSN